MQKLIIQFHREVASDPRRAAVTQLHANCSSFKTIAGILCLSVSLITKNYRAGFHKTWKGGAQAKEEPINSWCRAISPSLNSHSRAVVMGDVLCEWPLRD